MSEPIVSRSPPHTSSTASSVQPPAKTDSRRKSALLVVNEEVEAPADRVPQRAVPGGCVPGARGEKLQRVLEPGEDPRRGEHLDPRRRQLDRERQAVEVVTDLRARGQVCLVRLESRAHGARPLEEHAQGVVAFERPERQLLLAADAQPCAARDHGLHARARGDDRAERGRGLDDLLEVVDDEQQPAALDVRDEALLEIALGVEEPERPRDAADDQSGVAHRLERHQDDAVCELIGGRRGDLEGEAGLPDPSGPGDREQPDIVPVEERRRPRPGSARARSASSPARSRDHLVTSSCRRSAIASAKAGSLMSISTSCISTFDRSTSSRSAENSASSASGSWSTCPSVESTESPRSGTNRAVGPVAAFSLCARAAAICRHSSGVVRVAARTLSCT